MVAHQEVGSPWCQVSIQEWCRLPKKLKGMVQGCSLTGPRLLVVQTVAVTVGLAAVVSL